MVAVLDLLLVLVLAAAAVIPLIAFSDGEPEYAVIEADGSVYGRYRLSQQKDSSPVVVSVVTEYGEVTVEIGNSYAAIVSSDCPSHTCVKSGRITKPGRALICLPCRVTVRITGESEFDGMTG